jgi:hypothetical protein
MTGLIVSVAAAIIFVGLVTVGSLVWDNYTEQKQQERLRAWVKKQTHPPAARERW